MGRQITLTQGNDTFNQSAVSDNSALQIFGLGGNDTIVLDRTDDLGGSNRVDAGAGNDGVVNRKEFGNVILLGEGNDTYVGLGFGSFDTDRLDQVFGGIGADTFAVQTFKSQYFGETGNDLFHSVGRSNTFHGGTGQDTISYLPRSDETTSGVTVDLLAGLTQTSATRQERLISIEHVIGSSNNDEIFGSNVANRLTGGFGFDLLTGRGGADQFIFKSAADCRISATQADIIIDFSRADNDKVNLLTIDANVHVAGNQAFNFVTTGFTRNAGELRFDGDFVLGDLNGDGRADFRILMNEISTMQASDFVL
ncbi:hemolysin [Cypionkella aquatica]|uniref:Hemolysin n=1 Tax=Cypionkella aquatica TaxID=1756042 RepID=A0AA37TU74_9RHOB|nr:calcium-binding protein [Cypionkella aquatica]GLS87674.1 hemolysin [Cypionkella aquatica]